jgi:hypothetical protein
MLPFRHGRHQISFFCLDISELYSWY